MESILYGYGHFRRKVNLGKEVAAKNQQVSEPLFWMTGPVHMEFDGRNATVRNVCRSADLWIQ